MFFLLRVCMYSRQWRNCKSIDLTNWPQEYCRIYIHAVAFVLLFLSLFRFQNLTISIWTWMGLSTNVPTRTTKMSTFAFLRKRFLQTSSITWRCYSGSSSLARSSSWRWTVWHQGQKWTSREDGDSGRDGYKMTGNMFVYRVLHRMGQFESSDLGSPLNIKDSRTWLLNLGCCSSFSWGDQIKKWNFMNMSAPWCWISRVNNATFSFSYLIKMTTLFSKIFIQCLV